VTKVNGAAARISFRRKLKMPWKLCIRAGELLIALVLAVGLIIAWRADHADRAQLAAELATAKQSLAQADDRQHSRDSQLPQTLTTIAVEKRSVTTPSQVIRELPQQIGLPSPITLQSTPPGPAAQAGGQASGARGTPDGGTQRPTQAVIPAEDLKPLYDFTLDCKACQAKLSAAQGDLTDEKLKTTTLTKERNEAIRAAKGGSLLRRIARVAKWFAIGAAAGAVAARAAH